MQTVYPLSRTKFLEGYLQWRASGGHSFRAACMDSTYTYSSAHEFRDDLTGVLGTVALTGLVAGPDGWADAADATITGLTPGDTVRSFAIYRDTGSAATDELIWIATSHADTTPINRIVDGSGSMTFSFANTPGCIFQLGS